MDFVPEVKIPSPDLLFGVGGLVQVDSEEELISYPVWYLSLASESMQLAGVWEDGWLDMPLTGHSLWTPETFINKTFRIVTNEVL